MKKYLFIIVLILALIPLFIFSRENVEKSEETVSEEIVFEETVSEETVTKEEELISEISYESRTKFKMHMDSLDDYFDALTESIDRQNWNEINEYAMQMKNTSPVLFTGKKKEGLPHDFVLMDTMFHLYSLALIEASEAREMVKLNIEFENLKQTCDNCHERYKKKES